MNENLKVPAKFLIDLGENTSKALADGKFTGTEAISFLPLFMGVPDILQRKEAIAEEWKNRTTESLADLNEYISTELSLENKGLEAKIEKGLSALVALLDFIGEFKKDEEPVVAPV
jgi:hypothetical protein